MKKLLLSLAILGGSAAIFSSCNKIVDEIKKNINAFNYTAEANFTLPASLSVGQVYNEEKTYDLNINQIIEDNVDQLNIGIDDISKISINKITLTLENTDQANNWTNFESAGITANTDKGKANGKPDLSATKNIDDKEEERYSDKEITFADHNLKDYVNGEGTKVNYAIAVKARRNVNKELRIVAKIQYSFKP